MKKMKPLISTMLCLCAVCALAAPAHALEYTISAPGDPEYGKPTSSSQAAYPSFPAMAESSLTPLLLLSPQSLGDGFAGTPYEPVVTADGGAMKNEDLSKSAALIPPGFGTPTSYMLNTGEYLTPSSSRAAYPSLPANAESSLTPPLLLSPQSLGDGFAGAPRGNATEADTSTTSPATSVGFTEVSGGLYYSDGSLGTLKIPSIGLTVGVYEGTDSAALLKGAGHFTGTSIWMGNIPIAGHNRGVRNDFGKIHTLNPGDTITFTTKLGTRTYAVTGVTKVSVNDVSGLDPSAANTITLYTCVENQPAYRWCVTAAEV